jgi:hypothetical protein
VLAAAQDGERYMEWRNGHAEWKQAPLIKAWWDVTSNIFASFSRSKTGHLHRDEVVGKLDEPSLRPQGVPHDSIYLGGIGEGAWYRTQPAADRILEGERHTYSGEHDFTGHFEAEEALVRQIGQSEARLVHDSHFGWLTIEQSNGLKHRAYRIKND